MQQRRRNLFFVALGALVLATGMAGAAAATSSRSKVARHVTLAGHNIAGLDRAELRARVKSVDKELRASKVKVSAPKGGFTATLEQLGVARRHRKDRRARANRRTHRQPALACLGRVQSPVLQTHGSR